MTSGSLQTFDAACVPFWQGHLSADRAWDKSHGKQMKMNRKGGLEEKRSPKICWEGWGLKAKYVCLSVCLCMYVPIHLSSIYLSVNLGLFLVPAGMNYFCLFPSGCPSPCSGDQTLTECRPEITPVAAFPRDPFVFRLSPRETFL